MKIKTPDFLPPDRVEIDMKIEELKEQNKTVEKLKKEIREAEIVNRARENGIKN